MRAAINSGVIQAGSIQLPRRALDIWLLVSSSQPCSRYVPMANAKKASGAAHANRLRRSVKPLSVAKCPRSSAANEYISAARCAVSTYLCAWPVFDVAMLRHFQTPERREEEETCAERAELLRRRELSSARAAMATTAASLEGRAPMAQIAFSHQSVHSPVPSRMTRTKP